MAQNGIIQVSICATYMCVCIHVNINEGICYDFA